MDERGTVNREMAVKIQKAVLAIICIGIVGIVFTLYVREPLNNRAWDTEFEKTSMALFEENDVTLKNVRDFTYGNSEMLGTEWISEVTLNPEEIVRSWFVLEPFAEFEAIGHTFLTFEFSDGRAYSFSVEARRERGEDYSAFKGLLREYELAYTWGTERDFITRRVLFLNHPVRTYPLTITAEQSQKLFLGLLEKTNELSEKPRFYNTLTANCTNILAEIANDITPGTIPYDISWNLPGFSDRFLLKIGLISQIGTLEETQRQFDLTGNREQILEIALLPHHEFGKALRRLLKFE